MAEHAGKTWLDFPYGEINGTLDIKPNFQVRQFQSQSPLVKQSLEVLQ